MRKRWSLTTQLVAVMLFLVIGIIGLCCFLNSTFLESYYRFYKQKDLESGYQTIDTASREGRLESEDFDLEFEKLCTNENLGILVYRINEFGEAVALRSSYTQGQLLEMRMEQFGNLLIGGEQDIVEVIRENDFYTIERQTLARLKSEYLVLGGMLSDGETGIYIRSALQPVRETAKITNRFFLGIGLVALVVELILIIFLAKGISRPIRELTESSIHMTNLEFDVKYHSAKHSVREIEVLGNHMNELSDTLQQTISELKVANNELMQDIEKKEQIDEMRKEFLSNVSHELKTPLALIQGYAEGLRDGITEDRESMEFYSDVIIDEAAKMNRMVKKLLTLNQLEFGNEVVDMSRFDITELVRGVIAANSLLLENEGIRLVFEENEPVYVWGDEFKVEEVITNYLSNAIHYCQQEKRIEIRFENRGELLRVCVFNTGNPIPEEDLEKVWIKFYKVDKARTREYGGSGIGLSIVKAIMDSFHRECGVSNCPEGVEFWMELERGR